LYQTRFFAYQHLRQEGEMGGRSATAAAHHIYPALLDKTFELNGDHLRGFVVAALFIRQPSIRHTQHGEAREVRQGTNMVRHEIWAGGAIQTNGEQFFMRQRDVESFDALSR